VDSPSFKKPAPQLIVKRIASVLDSPPAASKSDEDAMKCERCGADMYRMHAVWRCPSCRFKTDCCGW
jgi:rubrerythrin